MPDNSDKVDLETIVEELPELKDRWNRIQILEKDWQSWPNFSEEDFQFEAVAGRSYIHQLIRASIKSSYVLAARTATLLKQLAPCEAYEIFKRRKKRLQDDGSQFLQRINSIGGGAGG